MKSQNYDFFIVNTGIDKRSSMLRSKHGRRSSAALKAFQCGQRSNGVESTVIHNQINAEDSKPSDSVPDTSYNEELVEVFSRNQLAPGTNIDELSSKMSSLKFVPPSVRFGRGGRRAGFSRT